MWLIYLRYEKVSMCISTHIKKIYTMLNLQILGSTNVKLWLGLLIVSCWLCWVVAREQTRFRLPFVFLTQCHRPEMTYRLSGMMSENQGSSNPSNREDSLVTGCVLHEVIPYDQKNMIVYFIVIIFCFILSHFIQYVQEIKKCPLYNMHRFKYKQN